MKKKRNINKLLLLLLSVAILISLVFLVEKLSLYKEIEQIEEYDTDLIIIEENYMELFTDNETCDIFINDVEYDGEIVNNSNGFKYYFTENTLPKDELFNLEIKYKYDKDKVEESIILDGIYIYTGEDLSDIKHLNEVKYLIILNSTVSGSLEVLEGLHGLKYLDLRGCKNLDGNIKSIAKLSKLEYLLLEDNKGLSGDIDCLSSLTNLEFMSLDIYSNTRIIGNLDSLSNLKDIKYLKIHDYNKLTGNLKSLENLKDLEYLDLLALQQVRGNVMILLNFNNLRYLSIVGTRIKGNTGTLSSLINLNVLKLRFNNKIWGSIKSFSNLDKLVVLDLNNVNLIYGSISKLSVLEYLDTVKIKNCPLVGGTLIYSNDKELRVKFFDMVDIMDSSEFVD